MKKIVLITFGLILNSCSFNIDSTYWYEKNSKKNDKGEKLVEIIKKSNDIRLMSFDEYQVYINNYAKRSEFPDIN